MRIVAICGSHPRHMFVLDKLIGTGVIVGVVLMKRENMIEPPLVDLSSHMKDLYERHFKLRMMMENSYFGSVDIQAIAKEVPVIEVSSEELNCNAVSDFIEKVRADTIFSYGPDLLHDNILSKVNYNAFNLHGGLSPWYKGAATMFWPFYFLEPNFVGTTLHYITKKIDAGNIVHHTVPKLNRGDCMHEVACKAIVAAAEDVCKVFMNMSEGKQYPGVQQKKNGKLFLTKDWRPEHLQLIYDVYDDKIVDLYLNGEINKNNEPELIKAI